MYHCHLQDFDTVNCSYEMLIVILRIRLLSQNDLSLVVQVLSVTEDCAVTYWYCTFLCISLMFIAIARSHLCQAEILRMGFVTNEVSDFTFLLCGR